MREKQLRRMKRGLEAYHPVNNSLVSQRLDSYASQRRARFAMILFDSVIERGGIFSAPNYQKFLKVLGVRCGCFEESQTVFDHYKHSYPEHEHEIYVYNQMIQLCRGNPREALKVFKEISALKQMTPNTFTFNFLLQSLLKPFVRHTAMTADELREMMHERNHWGTYEFGNAYSGDTFAKGDAPLANDPFKNVEQNKEVSNNEQVETAAAIESNERNEEHIAELRAALTDILDHVYSYDPVILANSFIQNTIDQLAKMPAFADFEPLLEAKQTSLDEEEQPVSRETSVDANSVQDQLAASYAKTFGRYTRKLAAKPFDEDQEAAVRDEARPKVAQQGRGL